MQKTIFTLLLAAFFSYTQAQDIESMADDLLGEQTDYALGTFYTSRIITGQSVFMMPKSGLDFRVHHRFGQFKTGFNELYGIDESSSFLSLDYGVTDYINIGIGRATYRDIFNSFLKISVLRQSTGAKNMPISLVYVGTCGIQSTIFEDEKRNEDFAARLSYTNQLLIARMFNARFSAQVTPTIVHRNLVPVGDYNNTSYALGVGGRYKITNTFSINAEWFHVFNPDKVNGKKMADPIAFGFDIQVAAHVFQVQVTNAESMTENAFITETPNNFFDGDIRLGFNISQVFTF